MVVLLLVSHVQPAGLQGLGGHGGFAALLQRPRRWANHVLLGRMINELSCRREKSEESFKKRLGRRPSHVLLGRMMNGLSCRREKSEEAFK